MYNIRLIASLHRSSSMLVLIGPKVRSPYWLVISEELCEGLIDASCLGTGELCQESDLTSIAYAVLP